MENIEVRDSLREINQRQRETKLSGQRLSAMSVTGLAVGFLLGGLILDLAGRAGDVGSTEWAMVALWALVPWLLMLAFVGWSETRKPVRLSAETEGLNVGNLIKMVIFVIGALALFISLSWLLISGNIPFAFTITSAAILLGSLAAAAIRTAFSSKQNESE